MQITYFVCMFFLIHLIATGPAQANYIDPGTGSYMLQVLVAGLMAFIYWLQGIKAFLHHIAGSLSKRKHHENV